MSDITRQNLIDAGFNENEWTDDGAAYTDYTLDLGDRDCICVIFDPVEVMVISGGTDFTVPNCQTMEDIAVLKRLFTNHKEQ